MISNNQPTSTYHNFYEHRNRKCCISFCPAKRVMSFGEIPFVGLHHFPRNPELLRKWHRMLGPLRAKAIPRICSVHFAPDSYTISDRNHVILSKVAYPTRYIRLTGPVSNVDHLKPAAPIEFADVPEDEGYIYDMIESNEPLEDDPSDTIEPIANNAPDQKTNAFETVPRKCAIPFCPARKLTSFQDIKFVGLHHFPKESAMRTKWHDIVGPLRANKVPRICSIHFAPEFRKLNDFQCRITLVKDAYPSLFVRLQGPVEVEENEPIKNSPTLQTDEGYLDLEIQSIHIKELDEAEYIESQIDETIEDHSSQCNDGDPDINPPACDEAHQTPTPDRVNLFLQVPRKCCILDCPAKRLASFENIKTVGLHNFPKDPKLIAIWHKVLGSWSQARTNPRICSIHFEYKFLIQGERNRVLLIPGAVPSRHLGAAKSTECLEPPTKVCDVDTVAENNEEHPQQIDMSEKTIGNIQVEMLDLLNVCRFCMRNDNKMSREHWFKWPMLEVTQLYQKITGQALPVSEHFSRFWCHECLFRLRNLDKAIDELRDTAVFWQNHLEQRKRHTVYESIKKEPRTNKMQAFTAPKCDETTTDDSSSDLDDNIDALTGKEIPIATNSNNNGSITGKPMITCELCHQSFLGKRNLQKHLLRFHKLFQDLYKRDRDVRQQKRCRDKYRLNELKQMKKRAKQLMTSKQHTQLKDVPVAKYTLCTMCGTVFQQNDDGVPRELCLICTNTMPSMQSVSNHMQIDIMQEMPDIFG